MNISRITLATLVPALVATLQGCMLTDTSHVVYLSPDGDATWTILESDAHSDGTDSAMKASEEAEWLAQHDEGRSGAEALLRHLGGSRPNSRVMRREAPFLAYSEAHVGTITTVLERFAEVLESTADGSLSRKDGEVTLEVVVHEDGQPATVPSETEVDAGIMDVDHLRLVLTRGRFISACGFVLENDRTALVQEPDDSDCLKVDETTLAYSLTWSEE